MSNSLLDHSIYTAEAQLLVSQRGLNCDACRDYKGLQIVGEMLILGGDTLKQAVGDLREGRDARAQVILLGIILSALEARTTKEA
jgi:hypothetical protein